MQAAAPVDAVSPANPIWATLNPAQRRAADADDRPLLIVAGAGTGKTQTLAHRVAALIARGADPRRILLLTFSRRAAQEMTRRALRLLARRPGGDAALPWAGTFHAIANRLLRHHAQELGLDPAFTLLDREDAADLLDRLRHERGLSRTDRRFPRKGTCLAIYSSVVNTQEPLRACLETRFPVVPGVGGAAARAVRRLRRGEGGARRCSTTTTCCCTGST